MFGRGAGIENIPDTLKSTSEGKNGKENQNRLGHLNPVRNSFALGNTGFLKAPTLREKPVCMLNDGFNYSHHMNRSCSSHFSKAPMSTEKIIYLELKVLCVIFKRFH